MTMMINILPQNIGVVDPASPLLCPANKRTIP